MEDVTHMTDGAEAATKPARAKAYLASTDVPPINLADALRLPKAIADELGKQASTPLQVAAAMRMKPTTGKFRTLAAAALAYGLTDAGAFAERIALTELGRRVVAPSAEGDDLVAMREAGMRPRVTREFLLKYNGSKWPREDIGKNVLETLGIPAEQAGRALELIHADAQELGYITEINGTEFVEVNSAPPAAPRMSADTGERITTAVGDEQPTAPSETQSGATDPVVQPPGAISTTPVEEANNRVFITHGKNVAIVEQIKKLLVFGGFEAVVAAENQTTAKPVPDKVMDDMRSCGAGIVHVGSEMKVLDGEGHEHQMLNPNVLIEIGAAMALYGRRFILLVERGVSLPSNLQGLYEVRYEGSGLDHESTMALLEAFAGFKRPSQAAA